MKPRHLALVVLLLSLGVGYAVTGHYLFEMWIGLDSSAWVGGEWIQSAVKLAAPGVEHAVAGGLYMIASVLGVGLAAFLAMRLGTRAARLDSGRREFLTGAGSQAGVALLSMLGAGAAGYARGGLGLGRGGRGWQGVNQNIGAEVVRTHPDWEAQWKGSRIRAHRRLGRTGWRVSDIVLGTGRIEGEHGVEIARQVMERGVNYLDTSPDYSGAGSERAIGQAVRELGNRDGIFLATKFCTTEGNLPAGTSVANYKRAVEESLRRLDTDYVDLCHIHNCDEARRLLDPNVHEAFDQLKQEGKVRFLGFSSHAPDLELVAAAAIASGRFDVMMVAYHHGQWARLGDLIQRARAEQDMGVVAMKTLKGAKHHGLAGFREEADAFSQAALKWVLSNPDVSCAVISFFELQHVDEYLYASGRQLKAADRAILQRYDRLIAGSYCAPHCGECLDSCPEQLAIDDVLRYRMYFEDYGWQKEAMRRYASLETNASVCAGCSAPCTHACPLGIPIPQQTHGAHQLLTLS